MVLSDRFRLLSHFQGLGLTVNMQEHAGTEPEHLLFRTGAEFNYYVSAFLEGALTKTDQLSLQSSS